MEEEEEAEQQFRSLLDARPDIVHEIVVHPSFPALIAGQMRKSERKRTKVPSTIDLSGNAITQIADDISMSEAQSVFAVSVVMMHGLFEVRDLARSAPSDRPFEGAVAEFIERFSPKSEVERPSFYDVWAELVWVITRDAATWWRALARELAQREQPVHVPSLDDPTSVDIDEMWIVDHIPSFPFNTIDATAITAYLRAWIQSGVIKQALDDGYVTAEEEPAFLAQSAPALGDSLLEGWTDWMGAFMGPQPLAYEDLAFAIACWIDRRPATSETLHAVREAGDTIAKPMWGVTRWRVAAAFNHHEQLGVWATDSSTRALLTEWGVKVPPA